jgi:hypothetical protein
MMALPQIPLVEGEGEDARNNARSRSPYRVGGRCEREIKIEMERFKEVFHYNTDEEAGGHNTPKFETVSFSCTYKENRKETTLNCPVLHSYYPRGLHLSNK